MTTFITEHWLDIATTLLGIAYLILEYRASIALWIVGIIMPAMDVYLYWTHGLYGDAGMAVYYTLAAVYGYAVWRLGKKRGQQTAEMPVTHMAARLYAPAFIFFAAAWAATYYVLAEFTNSTVPLLDAFTNAMSFVGLWALARKYVEQWLFWILVDAICCYLYVVKGIPFKAGLYGLYTAIAVMGYFKWRRMARSASETDI